MSSFSRRRGYKLLISTLVLTLLLAAISLVLADVTYQYDQDGRMTEACAPSGQAVTYKYDPDGNILSISHTPCPTPTATATP